MKEVKEFLFEIIQAIARKIIMCLFCGVRSMAIDLQYTSLLAKLERDLIATNGKYHLFCLVSLRKRHRSMVTDRAKQ